MMKSLAVVLFAATLPSVALAAATPTPSPSPAEQNAVKAVVAYAKGMGATAKDILEPRCTVVQTWALCTYHPSGPNADSAYVTMQQKLTAWKVIDASHEPATPAGLHAHGVPLPIAQQLAPNP